MGVYKGPFRRRDDLKRCFRCGAPLPPENETVLDGQVREEKRWAVFVFLLILTALVLIFLLRLGVIG